MKKIALTLSMLFFLVNIVAPVTNVGAVDFTEKNVEENIQQDSNDVNLDQSVNDDVQEEKEDKPSQEQEEVLEDNVQDEVIQEENEEDNLVEDEEVQDENVESDAVQDGEKENVQAEQTVKSKIYSTVKKNQAKAAYSISEEEVQFLDKEEYVADYQAALNMDYLVPMTDSKFEVVLAYENGDFEFLDTAETIDEAMNKSKAYDSNADSNEAIPCVIDNDGVIVYSTNAMARFIKHVNGAVANQTINVYPNSNLSGDNTYVNHNSIDDAPIIDDNGKNVKVLVNGFTGWVVKNTDEKNYDVVVVPMNQVKNPSYYYSKGGQLYHFISTDVTGKNGNSGNSIAVGVAPSYLKEGTKYYSYDGNYFYTNLDTYINDLKNNTTNNAVNNGNTFYNYYLYLPFRSKTSYNANQINSFINNHEQVSSTSKLRNLGDALINAQNKYGVNAAIILGVAINESGWGNSEISQSKNNLFGMAAFDSDTNQALTFNNPGESVNYFAKDYISTGYSDPQDWRYYGGFLGGKYLGANRKYASDPFWGEKAATHAFTMDKYLSGNDLSRLSDYNYNQLGMYTTAGEVKDSNNNLLYNVNQGISNNATFVGVPVVLTSTNTCTIGGVESYEIYPERQTQLPSGGGAQFPGDYDWNKKGYIKKGAVKLINTSTNKQPEITYSTHVQNVGWQAWRSNGQMSGTSGQGLRLEGIKIQLKNYPGASIRYSTHIQDVGWQEWKYDGDMSGTSGVSKRLEGIKIEATGLPSNVELQYRVHVQDVGWQEWKYNGEMAGTSGQGKRLEGIEIRVIEKTPMVRYKTHVQNIGWQGFVQDGQMSGTSGKSYRLEGIAIEGRNLPEGASIRYSTHIQDVGWQAWKYNGEMSGTSGASKRLEGIKIELLNAPGYHIEYRTHIQNVGWQGWKRDGEMSGTSGQSLRLEGIEIRIVRD